MPRLNNPRQEAVAQLKANAYLNPEHAPSDVQIVKKIYGYSQSVAEGNAHHIIESHGVQQRLNELITDDQIASKGKKLFNWKDPVIDKEGKTIANIPNGELQYKTWRDMMKIKGVLNDKPVNDSRSVHFNIDNGGSILIDSMFKKLSMLCDGMMTVSQSSTQSDSAETTQSPSSIEGKTPH